MSDLTGKNIEFKDHGKVVRDNESEVIARDASGANNTVPKSRILSTYAEGGHAGVDVKIGAKVSIDEKKIIEQEDKYKEPFTHINRGVLKQLKSYRSVANQVGEVYDIGFNVAGVEFNNGKKLTVPKNYLTVMSSFENGGDVNDDLLEFTIPTWAMSALVNGDESGLSDEDQVKLNKFVDETVAEYGNANFMLGGEEDQESYFSNRNDIDGYLGADVEKMYLRPSKEFAKGGKVKDIELPGLNLWLRGFGMDTNGNAIVKIGFPNDRAFSIQTNGSLPNTHRISKSGSKLSELNDSELKTIAHEVYDYVSQYGSKDQKSRLKKYSSFAAGGKANTGAVMLKKDYEYNSKNGIKTIYYDIFINGKEVPNAKVEYMNKVYQFIYHDVSIQSKVPLTENKKELLDGIKVALSGKKFSDGGITNSTEDLKSKIEKIIQKNLPGFWYSVSAYKGFAGGEYIAIKMAATDVNINGVNGQKHQAVSLSLEIKTMQLQPQVFGGMGGQSIYRKPDMNDPKEKYLAMKSVKIPFRKPQENEEAVLKAIDKFTKNYKQALIDNIDKLMYQNEVNYKELLEKKFEWGGQPISSGDVTQPVYAKGGKAGNSKGVRVGDVMNISGQYGAAIESIDSVGSKKYIVWDEDGVKKWAWINDLILDNDDGEGELVEDDEWNEKSNHNYWKCDKTHYGNSPSKSFASGGKIENQYTGKDAGEVWNAWTREQRVHFLNDHNKQLSVGQRYKNIESIADKDYSGVGIGIKPWIETHVAEGQYAGGGSMIYQASLKSDFLKKHKLSQTLIADKSFTTLWGKGVLSNSNDIGLDEVKPTSIRKALRKPGKYVEAYDKVNEKFAKQYGAIKETNEAKKYFKELIADIEK